MKAYQIMNDHAKWQTLERSALDCYWASLNVTDYADWLESEVLYEDTLRAHDFMAEVIKKPPHLSVTGVEEGGYERR